MSKEMGSEKEKSGVMKSEERDSCKREGVNSIINSLGEKDWKWTNMLNTKVTGSCDKNTFSKVLGLNLNVSELNE